jgi:hypothetical protein
VTPHPQEHGGAPGSAARLALLGLRGSIHPSVRLRPDAYALAAAPRTVLTAAEVVSALLTEPKPLRCRASAWGGVVKVRWDAPREGTSDWLAWRAADREGPGQDAAAALEVLARAAGRAATEVQVLCAAREETLLVSLADAQRWLWEYRIVRGGYAFDSADNELASEWPVYQEARARRAPYVLRLGELRTAAT